MAKTIDPALAARLRDESEQTREAAYPAGARPTRPNRSKVYSIRLSEEELVGIAVSSSGVQVLAVGSCR